MLLECPDLTFITTRNSREIQAADLQVRSRRARARCTSQGCEVAVRDAEQRVQAAIVLAAGGDLARLRQMLDLATVDWRDLLVAAGLADRDWQQQLSIELGAPPEQATGRL
jgi:hypothetical protein